MPIPVPKTSLILLVSCPTEGRFANVTDAGQDAVDAAASGAECGNRADSLNGAGELPNRNADDGAA
jgi:hypothetical protein